MEDELIRIGSGRSRGLGNVTATISDQGSNGRPGGLVTSTIRGNSREPANQLWGLGRWLKDSTDGDYGTWEDDYLSLTSPVERTDRGIRTMRAFTGDALAALRDTSIDQFIDRIKAWPVKAWSEDLAREVVLASNR